MIPQGEGKIHGQGDVFIAGAGHRIDRAPEVLVARLAALLLSQVILNTHPLGLSHGFHARHHRPFARP